MVISIQSIALSDDITDERAKELKQYIESKRKSGIARVGKMRISSKRKRILVKQFKSAKFLPKINLLKPGKFGYVDLYRSSIPFCRIFQIINENEFIASLHDHRIRFVGITQVGSTEITVGYLWIRGISTKKLTDDINSKIKFRGVFVSEATKKYRTVLGSKTVYVIRKISTSDLDKIKKSKI